MSGPLQRTPVFVDAAGRRRRWVNTALWSGAIVAVVYVALAASALLGGPRVDAPFLPQPFAAETPAHSSEEAAAPATQADPQPDTASREPGADDAEASPEPLATEAPAPAPAAVVTPAPSPAPRETAGEQAGVTGQEARADNPGAEHRTEPTTGGPGRP